MAGSDGRLAISPDGTLVAFRGQSVGGSAGAQLFLRSTRKLTANPLPGTQNASNPFFSPDGRWLGFWVDGGLEKIPLAGGEPIRLCDIPPIRGATWGVDGTIVLGSFDAGLMRVPEGGGTPEALTTLDRDSGERDHRWPQFLPGGRTVLYNVRSVVDQEIYSTAVVSLDAGTQQKVRTGGTNPVYAPSGHLLYSLQGTIYAIGFDVDALATGGSPQPVLQDVRFSSGSGNAHLALSATGAMVWAPGAWRPPETDLIAIDRNGATEVLLGSDRSYESPRPSPNGRHLALTIMSGVGEADIWIYEMDRELWRRLTSKGGFDPIWSPDGRHIVFSSDRNGPFQLFLQPADGSAPAEPLTDATNWEFPGGFSPDGRYLLFQRLVGPSQWDVFRMEISGDRAPENILGSTAMEVQPTISPDGRWLAFSSDQTGRAEIYVQSFPEPSSRVQISTDGGSNPLWHPDGKELLYLEVPSLFSAGRKILSVAVDTRSELVVGRPSTFAEFDFDISTQQAWHAFRFLPGTERLVLARPTADAAEDLRLVYAPDFVGELEQALD